MLERQPQKPESKREQAFKTLHAVNDELGEMNAHLSEIFSELVGAKDILKHTQQTKGDTDEGRTRITLLNKQIARLKEQALALGQAIEPFEHAADYLADHHSVPEA